MKIVENFLKLYRFPILNKLSFIVLSMIGVEIPVIVKIGKGVSFPHNSIGTVIHPNTRIEDNVKIYQNVTIGRSNIWEHPNKTFEGFLIKKGAVLCAGSKILGKNGTLVVGENTIIGANSVLTRSTGDNEIWAGIPARKIKDRESAALAT